MPSVLVPDRQFVTGAFVSLLGSVTGRPVGLSRAPAGAGGDENVAPEFPYCIVYPIVGTPSWGPNLFAPEQVANFTYQVTSLGLRGDQTEWMSDAVRRTVVGRSTANGSFLHSLSVVGLTVLDRLISTPISGPTRQDLIFQSTEDFRIVVESPTS